VNLRRLEEIALNASGPANPRFFDGWMLGFTPGKSKRVRSVNPFFGSSLPLETKFDTCKAIYATAGLPCIIRLTPFAQPPELEDWLAAQGYERFDDTMVMVPINFTWLVWGWPNRFLDRMRSVGSEVILIGPYSQGDAGTSGIDTADEAAAIPARFSGYVWTNEIATIAPLLRP